MSRKQVLKSGSVVTALVGTPAPLSATDKWVKSVTIQALSSNTDFVYVGDVLDQFQAIEPRRSMVVWGDNLDHGTAGVINLADIYVKSNVNNEGVTYTYLEGK